MSSTLTQTQEYYKQYYINNKEKINERQYAIKNYNMVYMEIIKSV